VIPWKSCKVNKKSQALLREKLIKKNSSIKLKAIELRGNYATIASWFFLEKLR
jgi:hypothetical protein